LQSIWHFTKKASLSG